MEERTVLVYLPPSYSALTKPYPVVYVTDGSWHIHHLSGIISFLVGNNFMPDSILVAIPHLDRDQDLVPQALNTTNASGNADLFLSFIEFELIPYINETYHTQPYRALAGHSYGGLFTTYTMIHHPNLFNGYIAADPSLWWDNQRMQTEMQSLLANIPGFERSYYFDQSEIPDMGGVQFSNMLTNNAPPSFRWMFERKADETHNSIVHKSFYNGLEFIFSDWPYEQVTISPAGGLFRASEPVSVRMTHPSNGVIRYTTDGTDPTQASPVYTGPILISQNSNIRASVFLSNNRISIPNEAIFSEAVLFPALTGLSNLQQGLSYELYRGQWSALPDFTTLLPNETGTVSGVSISQWNNQDYFAVKFSGYINIPTEGIYTFSLSSDDGSVMYIDDSLLISNDRVHADEEKIGYVLLGAGYHRIEVRFFERSGDETLTLRYIAPGQSFFRSVYNSMLFF
jgi:predicted alpha/beta superfamily hydrolase